MAAENEFVLFRFDLGESESNVRSKELPVIQYSTETFRPAVGEKVVRTTGMCFPDNSASVSVLIRVLW
jgi:hypothetical protein